MPQYRRLTQSERHRIEARHRDGEAISEIARELGRHRATISRELGNNATPRGYRAEAAQAASDLRRTRCRRKSVVTELVAADFHRSLLRGESPELFSGVLGLKRRRAPSTSTLYRYARAVGWSRKLLPRSGRRGAGRFIQRQRPDWVTSISERPAAVENRRTFGHWERDTLFAANGQLLLVLIERKSRYTLIAPLQPRTAEAAARLTKKLLRRTKLPVKSITNDNGREFFDGYRFKIPVYYCDPGKPYQRGSVENVNRLLRRYITRSTNLADYSAQQIRNIERAVNNRPKKCLGFLSPAQFVRAKRLR